MTTVIEFAAIRNETPGLIASLLTRSYADLVASDPSVWKGEETGWEQYGREVFEQPTTVGASLFLTRVDGFPGIAIPA
jgi:hypothetical protein